MDRIRARLEYRISTLATRDDQPYGGGMEKAQIYSVRTAAAKGYGERPKNDDCRAESARSASQDAACRVRH